ADRRGDLAREPHWVAVVRGIPPGKPHEQMAAEHEPNSKGRVEPPRDYEHRPAAERGERGGLARHEADAVDVHGAKSRHGAPAGVVTSTSATADDHNSVGVVAFLERAVQNRRAVERAALDGGISSLALDVSRDERRDRVVDRIDEKIGGDDDNARRP